MDERGFVTCAKHNTRRKVGYCFLKPVYNADHEVVGHVYECKSDQICSIAQRSKGKTEDDGEEQGAGIVFNCSSTRMQGEARDDPRGPVSSSSTAGGRADSNAESTSTVFSVSFTRSESDATGRTGTPGTGPGLSLQSSTPAGEEAGQSRGVFTPATPPTEGVGPATVTTTHSSTTTMSTPGTRAPQRYYDLMQRNAGGGGGGGGGLSHAKKVCWHCGLAGHEKPECPNVLCRTCHAKRLPFGHYHNCEEVVVSPFIVLPATLPSGADGMAAVRCLYCNQYGHFDCSQGQHGDAKEGTFTQTSCCYCGEAGHDAYDCEFRERMNPDRWVQRVWQRYRREMSGANVNYVQPMHQHEQQMAAGYHGGGGDRGGGYDRYPPGRQGNDRGGYDGSPGGAPSGYYRGGGGGAGFNQRAQEAPYNDSAPPFRRVRGDYYRDSETGSSRGQGGRRGTFSPPPPSRPTSYGGGGGNGGGERPRGGVDYDDREGRDRRRHTSYSGNDDGRGGGRDRDGGRMASPHTMSAGVYREMVSGGVQRPSATSYTGDREGLRGRNEEARDGYNRSQGTPRSPPRGGERDGHSRRHDRRPTDRRRRRDSSDDEGDLF